MKLAGSNAWKHGPAPIKHVIFEVTIVPAVPTALVPVQNFMMWSFMESYATRSGPLTTVLKQKKTARIASKRALAVMQVVPMAVNVW